MTIENQEVDVASLVIQGDEVVSKPESLEDALKLLDEVKTKNAKLAAVNKGVVESRNEFKLKLRKFENTNEEKLVDELAEQGKFKELYESTTSKLQELQTKIRTNSLDNAMKAALSEAGARSVNTVMKLVDKDSIEFDDDGIASLDSVKAAIEAIKAEVPDLFGTSQETGVKPPPVKRAGDSEPQFSTRTASDKIASGLAKAFNN